MKLVNINEAHPALDHKSKIFFWPPLFIKFGLIKLFVKAMDKESEGFDYLKQTFLKISEAKLRERIFLGPQITQIFKDQNFSTKIDFYRKKSLEGI
jgi:hypothetical protein